MNRKEFLEQLFNENENENDTVDCNENCDQCDNHEKEKAVKFIVERIMEYRHLPKKQFVKVTLVMLSNIILYGNENEPIVKQAQKFMNDLNYKLHEDKLIRGANNN